MAQREGKGDAQKVCVGVSVCAEIREKNVLNKLFQFIEKLFVLYRIAFYTEFQREKLVTL